MANWWQQMMFLLLLAGATACHRHVIVRETVVGMATMQKIQWLCESGNETCEPGGTVDDAMWNQSRTTRIPIAHCEHGIAQVLVENANRKNPRVYVVCKDKKLDDSCADGAAQVPDVVNGGLKCPE